MNYTAFTAVIFTFHNLSTAAACIFALIFSAIFYGIFLRKTKHRLVFFFLALIVFFIVGLILAGEFFRKNTITVEIIQAG